MNLYICIHGILGGTRGKNGKGETISPSVLYEHLYEQIIEPNEHYFDETNIVIHSWSEKQKNKIIDVYQPKNFIIEKQKHFTTLLPNRKFSKVYSLFESMYLIDDAKDEDTIFSIRFDNFYKEKIVFEDLNQYLIKSKVCFVGDPNNWRVFNDRRLQDLFFIAKYEVVKNVFTKENYKKIVSMMNDEQSNCYCSNHGRQLDNHSVIRCIFEDNNIHRLDNYVSLDRKRRHVPYQISTWRDEHNK